VTDDEGDSPHAPGYAAERFTAFSDAVVAIAITLLILPLMESVGDISSTEGGTWRWLGDHHDQLVSFVLSFAIIAMFWVGNHRQFSRVQRVDAAVIWLMMAWLVTIVWLPVATSITGAAGSGDPVAKSIYMGSMVVTSLLSLCTRLYLRQHPGLHDTPETALIRGVGNDLSLAVLFSLALVISLLFPAIGYYSLILMGANGVLERTITRVFLSRDGRVTG
jgi:uncharacterized membrane protein